jgi:tetraacyldisaccharide 4'-kinase
MAVTASSDANIIGDEPLLLARRSGDACPVWVGHDRSATAQALLAAHPGCNVLICDDGLQHYRLRRDLEIVVVDGERRFGNGLLLPAGPLRESIGRLESVDAVVINGHRDIRGVAAPSSPSPLAGEGRGEGGGIGNQGKTFQMRLAGESFYNLLSPDSRLTPAAFMGKRLHAIAGIGNPQRFFDYLQGLGLAVNPHAFPDHHPFKKQELDFTNAEAIFMTEKDAVKCLAFANEKLWVLPVHAELDAELGKIIMQKLGK